MLRTETGQAQPGAADAETYWRWEQQISVCEPHTEMQEETKPEYTRQCVGPTQKHEKMGAHSRMAVCKPYRDIERNQSRPPQVSMCGRGPCLAPHPQINWCVKDLRIPEIWEGPQEFAWRLETR